MVEIKGNIICPKCGCKVDGGYCECLPTTNIKIPMPKIKEPKKGVDVSRIIVEYANGKRVDVVKGYLVSFDDEGNSSCIEFNV